MQPGVSVRFPIVILPAENTAGFELKVIWDPDSGGTRDPARTIHIYAVVCQIDHSHRVVKTRATDGSTMYLVRRAVGTASDLGEWRTVLESGSDPFAAVAAAKHYTDTHGA